MPKWPEPGRPLFKSRNFRDLRDPHGTGTAPPPYRDRGGAAWRPVNNGPAGLARLSMPLPFQAPKRKIPGDLGDSVPQMCCNAVALIALKSSVSPFANYTPSICLLLKTTRHCRFFVLLNRQPGDTRKAMSFAVQTIAAARLSVCCGGCWSAIDSSWLTGRATAMAFVHSKGGARQRQTDQPRE